MTTHAERQWEYFEERAAIREYDGGMTRQDAELAAQKEMEEKFSEEIDK